MTDTDTARIEAGRAAVAKQEHGHFPATDQEVARRVYEDAFRDYHEALAPLRERFATAKRAYATAGDELDVATAKLAKLEGKIEALRELAAKDGITL